MERSEPSLVPEWLKGASGGSGAPHHAQPLSHQDESGSVFLSRQRSQPHGSTVAGHGDYDSPRYLGSAERLFYATVRRGSSAGSANERPSYDRDSFSHSRPYSSFGRSPSYRVYDGLDRDREGQRDRDWDWERDRDREFRDRERERTLAFGAGDDRDIERERSDATFRRPTTSGTAGRYESDLALRRSQSLGSNRGSENGEKKAVGELGGLPTAAPTVSSVSLTSSMQKAAFERNFPSLGAQERQSAIQSGTGNVAALSPRPSWQGSTSRPDGRTGASPGMPSTQGAISGSSSAGGVVSIGAEGWNSALAEAPPVVSSTIPVNNGVSPGVATVTTISPTPHSGGTLSTSLSAPKMAETLAQNPSRIRTPPQFVVETQTQRLEELQFKQSRQLVPIKPSFPKTMGVSPRDKSKTKVVRAVDVVAPIPTKLSQPSGSSQLLSAPYRLPAAMARTETSKAAPPGKLLVNKARKEANPGTVLTATSMKADNIPASVGTVGTVVAGLVSSGSLAANTMAAPPRKQKQLLDRRAVPITPISVSSGLEGGNGLRIKDATDDKRPPAQVQNRSDFFNALRKKAAGVGLVSGNIEKAEVALAKGDDNVVKDLRNSLQYDFSTDSPQLAGFDVKENGVESSGLEDPTDTVANHASSDLGKENLHNGLSVEGFNGLSESPNDLGDLSASRQGDSVVGGSEEEEAAFLRSLGWEESAEGGEEALTEEEINAFYQERMQSMSNKPSLHNPRSHRLKPLDLFVGSIGSISSGLSTSDSESDEEVHTRC